jgi:hypothetical protein
VFGSLIDIELELNCFDSVFGAGVEVSAAGSEVSVPGMNQ